MRRSRCYSILDEGAAVLQEIKVRENTARMNVEQLKVQRKAAGTGREALEKESAELKNRRPRSKSSERPIRRS